MQVCCKKALFDQDWMCQWCWNRISLCLCQEDRDEIDCFSHIPIVPLSKSITLAAPRVPTSSVMILSSDIWISCVRYKMTWCCCCRFGEGLWTQLLSLPLAPYISLMPHPSLSLYRSCYITTVHHCTSRYAPLYTLMVVTSYNVWINHFDIPLSSYVYSNGIQFFADIEAEKKETAECKWTFLPGPVPQVPISHLCLQLTDTCSCIMSASLLCLLQLYSFKGSFIWVETT